MTIAEKLQAVAENEQKVYDAGIRKIIEKPVTEIKIPEGTQSIRPYCFYNYDELQSVSLPASVKNVNESAFEACGVTSLIIPEADGLSIGKKAFANMASLETVHFSGRPKSIHTLAFMGSSAMDIYVPWNEGEVGGAPWGANDATIHYAVTNFISVVYDSSNPLSITDNTTRDGLYYQPKGGRFKTAGDALVWTTNGKDGQICSTLGNIASMYSDRINYDVVLSKNGSSTPAQVQFTLYTVYTVNSEATTSKQLIKMWEADGNGDVIFRPTGEVIATLTNEPTHIRMSVDFRLGTVSYCDENFKPIKTAAFTVNGASGAKSVNEWRKCFKTGLLRLYAKPEGGSIKIHSINAHEGAVEYTLLPDECFESIDITWTADNVIIYGLNGYFGSSPTVIVPKTHSDKTIRCINYTAFKSTDRKIGQVFLPSTIERLSSTAFGNGQGAGYFDEIFVPWSEGTNKYNPAPWGAPDATIYYDYDTDVFYE